MAIIGNTVRLIAEFKTFSGVLSDVTSVTLTIKDNKGTTLKTATADDIQKQATGVYYYDYTIPDGTGNLSYEWKGVLEGSDIVNRSTIKRVRSSES